jgi:hypothetical protein
VHAVTRRECEHLNEFAHTADRARPEIAGYTAALAIVRSYPVAVAAAVSGIAVRILFWTMTDRRFEDALITIVHAQNLLDGLGLTHHPGEPRTHGFTSAISVLVPLAGEAAHDGGGLFALRFVSLLAFVVAVVCAAGIGIRLGVPQSLMVFPLAYLALDRNQIFYGMSGMETEIATAILLAGVYALMRERVVLTGVLLGVALLARPDFVLWVVPALVFLLLRRFRDGLVAGGIAACFVLPWLAFTTAYYGSPVPQTIRAKSARYPAELPSPTDPAAWLSHTWDRLSELSSFGRVFVPFLENGYLVSAPVSVMILAYVAAWFVVFAAVGAFRARGCSAWRAAAAYLVLFTVYRIYLLPNGYYEWYYVPFVALAAVAAAAGLAVIHPRLPRTSVAIACVFALAFAVHLPSTLVLEARLQHRVEDQVRKRTAVYLDTVVAPNERVASESAGYIGYYSRVTLYDYPGLTSPASLRALERLGVERHSFIELINATRPEWLVLRPLELDALRAQFPSVASSYVVNREFRVDGSKADVRSLGVEYGIDNDLLVLRTDGSRP